MRVILLCICALLLIPTADAYTERNKAEPVQEVLFGTIDSVRNITEQEIIEDRNKGWKVFGGALVGGVIGHQFGSGSGNDVATVLGALIGGSMANNRNPQYKQKTLHLVELMIRTDEGKEYMVVQDLDPQMIFNRHDEIRMIFLANGSVRIDKQM